MKALSLKQPWAELVLQGKKKIEIRKWNTHFRGEFLLHASKIPDQDAMKKFGFYQNSEKDKTQIRKKPNNIPHKNISTPKVSNLPLGSIVGKAVLVEVKNYKNEQDFQKDKSLHLATQEFGSYGFILKNVERLKPIKCKGSLNFWEFKDKL
jgi:hypothetical protein